VILEQTEEPMFATAVYLIVDLAKREVRFANAGIRARCGFHGETILCIRSTFRSKRGPALGLFENSAFSGWTLPAGANDFAGAVH